MAATLKAIVLAGERSGGNALAREHNLSAGVLVDVNGKSSITRVIDALRASSTVSGGCVVGPAAPLPQNEPALRELFAPGDYTWLAPAAGPSASALAGSEAMNEFPVLLTAADHALLTPAIIDEFCRLAQASAADFVVGLVPYHVVSAHYPESRRTRLRFRDGAVCGANLFLLKTREGHRALKLWQALEQDRKRPWRLALGLGAVTLCRFLLGTLDAAQAFQRLSVRAGARIDYVHVPHARAAIDVDSSADLALARRILGEHHA